SRRRHTIFSRDWSSDVCSSDLASEPALKILEKPHCPGGDSFVVGTPTPQWIRHGGKRRSGAGDLARHDVVHPARQLVQRDLRERSEERRVGKQCKVRAVAKERK